MESEILNTQIPERTIYKSRSLWFGSLIGGPLVAGYIIAENFKAFNEPRNAQKTWVITIIATIVIFAGAFSIPDNVNIPNQLIPLTYTLIASSLFHIYFGTKIESHIESGGQVYKWGRVVTVSLIGLAVILVGLLGAYLISEPMNDMAVNTKVYGTMKHEINYSNTVSEEEVDNLANAFVKTSFFDDAVTKHVYVEKLNNNYKISIPCNESIANDSAAIESFFRFEDGMQALYPNNKLEFNLNLVIDGFDNGVKRFD